MEKIWEENNEISEKEEARYEVAKAKLLEVVKMFKRIQPVLGLKTMRVACSI